MARWVVRLFGCLLAAGIFLSSSFAAEADANVAEQSSPEMSISSYSLPPYRGYIRPFEHEAKPAEICIIRGEELDFLHSTGVQISEVAGKTAAVTDSQSIVIWEIDVCQEGLYHLQIEYYPLEGNGGSIERRLSINGEMPCAEVSPLVFSRVWKDENSKPYVDSMGNEYPPMQVEAPAWQTVFAKDSLGYVSEPLYFYFKEGINTIELEAVKEPMAVGSLTLCQYEIPRSYADVSHTYQNRGYTFAPQGAEVKIQAERTSLKSDSTLSAEADRSSALTEDTDIAHVTLNAIGGNWAKVGQWISYEARVRETGLYELVFRFKQNYMAGNLSTRTLYIDGEIPFAEAQVLEFNFSNSWQTAKAGGDEPYLFYFEAGRTYDIRLECVMGFMNEVLWETQQSVYTLNDLYRRIKMIVGSFPDPNRDYHLAKQVPGCLDVLSEQRDVLRRLAGVMEEYGQGKSSHYSMLQKLVIQIEGFLRKPDTIAVRLENFASNIAALLEFSLDAAYQPLLLDYIMLCPPESTLPKADTGILGKIWYEIRLFFQSFFSDYNTIYAGGDTEKSVEVWMITGRDQAQTLRSIAEKDFSSQYGIGVNIRLVKEDTLLPAVASGQGPDVSLTMPRSLPVDYGLRAAVMDLNRFPDLPEVLKRFNPQSYEPFRLGDKLFALPEQELFLMMFYRKDILDSLGVKPPDTWDDLFDILYILHQNSMDIGLPNIATSDAGQAGSAAEMYNLFLLQNGGTFYNAQRTATLLDQNIALEAFEVWSSLYTKYKVSAQMNHWTRFRSGEAPILIHYYNYYNIFEATAPELRGLWDIAPVPGMRTDSGINRSISNTVNGTVIFTNAIDPDASWSFVKWWLSEDTQVDYSRGLENIMGPSARVPAANLNAFARLSLPRSVLEIMTEQRQQIKAMPEVPGSYMVNRSINAAIRTTISVGGNATEILLDRNKLINKEIALRRREFGLD